MSITDLIEKYSGPDTSQDVLKEFAVELLEMVRTSGAPCSFVATQNAVIVRSIDQALEELRK